MKYAIMVLLALVVFVLALGGALALTGNLTPETFDKLMGKETEGAMPEAEPADPLDPIARQLRRKEQDLSEKERLLDEREAQITRREQGLATLQQELDDLQKRLLGAESDLQAQREQEIETVANTIAEMKPKSAAERIENMPLEDIVAVLRKMKDKDRGAVVEAMEPEIASEVLRRMQEPSLP